MIEGPIDDMYTQDLYKLESTAYSDLYINEDGETMEWRRSMIKHKNEKPTPEFTHNGKRYTLIKRRVFTIKTEFILEQEIEYSEEYKRNKVTC